MPFALIFRILCLFSCAALISGAAYANPASEKWTDISTRFDPALGTKACNPEGSLCVELQCAGSGLELLLTSNSGKLHGVGGTAILSVDQRPLHQFSWQDREGSTWELASDPSLLIDLTRHQHILQTLQYGQGATVQTREALHAITLNGAAAELSRVSQDCTAMMASQLRGIDTFNGRYERLSDEATMNITPGSGEVDIRTYKDSDLVAADLRSGLTDPFLRNMSDGQCHQLCTLTKDCWAYTHNKNTCILKSHAQRVISHRGATSTTITGTLYRLPPPPTQGRGTIIDRNTFWRPSDTHDTWLQRLRGAAVSQGGNCQQETNIVKQAISGMTFDIAADSSVVGQPIRVKYQNMALSQRIPSWLILSSEVPARFSGTGFFALTPDTKNPFGLSPGLGRDRALVALAARGAGTDGQIDVVPLRAGQTKVTAQIGVYLRACQNEVVFDLGKIAVETATAPPRIVLNTPAGRSTFRHLVHIPKFKRAAFVTPRRFLLVDETDGTEILQQSGNQFHLSPTQRFIAVLNNQAWEIYDVIDGAQVARLRNGELGGAELFWAHGDSFAVTTMAPWGEVNIASTLWDGFKIERQVTGPSCCPAQPRVTRIGIDLENAAASIWGKFGFYVGALQNSSFAVSENDGSAYASSQLSHSATHQMAYNAIGPVAPVSFDSSFQVAGGLTASTHFKDGYRGNESDRDSYDPIKAMSDRLARVGLRLDPITPPAAPSEPDFEKHLPRIGLHLARMVDGIPAYERIKPASLDQLQGQVRGVLETREEDDGVSRYTDLLRLEAWAKGWPLTWRDPEGEDGERECYHLQFGGEWTSGSSDDPGPLHLPRRNLFSLTRIPMPDAPIWLAWHSCEAGGTFGSLRGESMLLIYDLSKPAPQRFDDVVADANGFMVNNRIQKHFESPSRYKANENVVLSYAPGAGALAVYDRKTRRFSHIATALENGDILYEAYVTADHRHVIQGNVDGSFYVYRISNGTQILSGRVIEDEVVVWNSSFEFDASAEAEALIDLTFPGQSGQFSLDRFGSKLRVDELAQKTMTLQHLPQPQSLTVPPSLKGDIALVNDREITLNLKFDTDQVTQVTIFQDGSLTAQIPAAEAAAKLVLPRTPDARWVTAIAEDINGFASLPVSVDLGDPKTAQGARTHAVILGVNTYQDDALPSLNFALRDAGKFAQALSEQNQGADNQLNMTLLKDRRASTAKLRTAITDTLAQAREGDHVLFYFAGHGLRDANGRFYLALSSTDPANLSETAVPFAELTEMFKDSPARMTVILDACHSGSAGTGFFASTDAVTTDLADLGSNVTMLAASKGREVSIESAETDGGLFTDALVAVLSTQRTEFDRNLNGRIEASELYLGVKSKVVAQSEGKQTPWLMKVRLVGDYVVF